VRFRIIRLGAACAISALPLIVAAAAPPAPPVKPGLWEVTMTSLDANGKEMPSPQQAAMARMPPEARARLAEAMKARGAAMPDENGAMKVCLTKESLQSNEWQQVASDTGCSTTYANLTGSAWKWHTSCTALKTESDGESVFNGAESYRTKVTTTATTMGSTRTSTRITQGKWLGSECGAVKPITANGIGKR
jgi:hypothetical protein